MLLTGVFMMDLGDFWVRCAIAMRIENINGIKPYDSPDNPLLRVRLQHSLCRHYKSTPLLLCEIFRIKQPKKTSAMPVGRRGMVKKCKKWAFDWLKNDPIRTRTSKSHTSSTVEQFKLSDRNM